MPGAPDDRRQTIVTAILCVVVAGTAVFLVLGIVARIVGEQQMANVDLDGEHNWPAGWSAFVLFLGVLAALWAWRAAQLGWPALAMAALLSCATVDEWSSVHEWVNNQHTGVAWQLYALPLLVLGAAAVVTLVRRADVPPRAKVLLLGGCGAWALSQVLESIQWWDGVQHVQSAALMIVEETLETTGSALLALAFATIALSVYDRVDA